MTHWQAAGQEKLAAARSAAQDAASDAKTKYDDSKAKFERKSAEGKAVTDGMANEAKAGWSSWWRWGNAQADETKRKGSSKVTEVAEDVRKEASKHSSG
jgi:hypothetical protein